MAEEADLRIRIVVTHWPWFGSLILRVRLLALNTEPGLGYPCETQFLNADETRGKPYHSLKQLSGKEGGPCPRLNLKNQS